MTHGRRGLHNVSAVQAVFIFTSTRVHVTQGDSSLKACMPWLCTGVIIFWGLSEPEISKVLTKLHSSKYMVDPLTDDETEQDTFSVVIGAGNGSIANDTITLPQVYYSEWRIKMAISHALAQSSKLCLYEERMSELVSSTKDMPTHLAKTGKVRSRRAPAGATSLRTPKGACCKA